MPRHRRCYASRSQRARKMKVAKALREETRLQAAREEQLRLKSSRSNENGTPHGENEEQVPEINEEVPAMQPPHESVSTEANSGRPPEEGTEMPPKKVFKAAEVRIAPRRAASKEALRHLSELNAEEAEQIEILSDDDEDIPIEIAAKKKYRVMQKKSSDDRDILILKSVTREPTLTLDVWVDELTPQQLDLRKKQQAEHVDMQERIDFLLKSTKAEIVFEGDHTTVYETDVANSILPSKPAILPPAAPPIPVTVPGKSIVKPTTSAVKPPATPPSKPTTAVSKLTTPLTTPPVVVSPTTMTGQNSAGGNYSLVVDPQSGRVVGTVTPANQLGVKTRKRTKPVESPVPSKIAKPGPPLMPQYRPTESTAVGGIKPVPIKKAVTPPVVDLTNDDKLLADSKEISFNKLQGKTFPSLVVVARPNLKVSATANATDRAKLDLKVKSVLMHPPSKFTEWLIQQGLIKSEQNCTAHMSNKLKLGMYSDVTKFPFSGGYVWISECCPSRFVSVFSGSLFEGSPHPPSVLLKLIYHWACQTNVQNVVQWVKVENLYVKGLNTWLRAVCSVGLHTHVHQMGGPGVKVEIGVISLGTTSQDGHQRQVKVEVLGILETETKRLRLRAVEPSNDNERHYKKRFSKILEPLTPWVHRGSVIVTDLTVDKNTLQSMGFHNIHQSNSSGGNQQIMDYLRRIVPRMFQNTLSLLSRQIIQQFLDELVWREWFGTTSNEAFDNILLHLSEQTKVEPRQSIIFKLNKVSANPFKNWNLYIPQQTAVSITNNVQANDAPRRQRRRQVGRRSASPTHELLKPSKNISPDFPEMMVSVEHYYYGTMDGINSTPNVNLNIKCHLCKEPFSNNISLMVHYFKHAHNITGDYQCKYCLTGVPTADGLESHIKLNHPTETKVGNEFACVICEIKFSSTYLLGKHMSVEHQPSELPYQCGSCTFRCSSHKEAIDHFYDAHNNQGILQCPFCLKSSAIATPNKVMPQLLHMYMAHLQKHQRKPPAKKCTKCVLWFIQKDGAAIHMKMHDSQRKQSGMKPWPVIINGVTVPKSINDYFEEEVTNLSELIVSVSEEKNCKECGKQMTMAGHYPSVLMCSNETCQYVTCCKSAMDFHEKKCKDFKNLLPRMRLPFEMFCVCGYSNVDGNLLANHLAVCERHSAYPSMKAAKAATVTRSVLDVLGLARRPEEPSASADAMLNGDAFINEPDKIEMDTDQINTDTNNEDSNDTERTEESEKVDGNGTKKDSNKNPDGNDTDQNDTTSKASTELDSNDESNKIENTNDESTDDIIKNESTNKVSNDESMDKIIKNKCTDDVQKEKVSDGSENDENLNDLCTDIAAKNNDEDKEDKCTDEAKKDDTNTESAEADDEKTETETTLSDECDIPPTDKDSSDIETINNNEDISKESDEEMATNTISSDLKEDSNDLNESMDVDSDDVLNSKEQPIETVNTDSSFIEKENNLADMISEVNHLEPLDETMSDISTAEDTNNDVDMVLNEITDAACPLSETIGS